MTCHLRTPLIYGFGTLIAAVGITCILQKFCKESCKYCECSNRVKNKVIVITGATSGIGFEVALQLAKQGARLFLLCRNEKLGEEVVDTIIKKSRSISVYFVHLNLANLESINSAVEEISAVESKVDILIHNAGVFHADPKVTGDRYEITFQTNFIGPVILTDKLLHMVIEAKSPRIIFLTSISTNSISLEEFAETPSINFKEIPRLNNISDFVRNYAYSKFALKLYAAHLAYLKTAADIDVTSVDPGTVNSNILRYYFNHWYDFPQRILCYLFMKTCREGAQSVVHACNVETLSSGSLIRNCEEVEKVPLEIECDTARQFMIDVNKKLEPHLN